MPLDHLRLSATDLAQYQDAASQELARRHLLDFVLRTKPDYQVAPHHQLLAGMLELVEAGVVKRLIVETPPRYGKSEMVSKRFPAWYMGRHPAAQYVSASYAQELADTFSRGARDILRDERWPFPAVKIAEDVFAVRRWQTNHGGVFVSAGVGSGITGRGADVLSIDDPVKDREEADSPTVRQSVWDWYTSTARTRLMPHAAVLLTMTRWQDDDLAGRLIRAGEDGEGEQWLVVKLPALSDGKLVQAEITLPDGLARKTNIQPQDRLTCTEVVDRLRKLLPPLPVSMLPGAGH